MQTWATIVVFILNLVLNPDVQFSAQAALDRVVGPDRLPTFSDRADLPLIDYIVQETFRWAAASPLGAPHRSMADDTYKGYFIPAGSFVFANAQAMSRDERDYREPERFEPMRYAPVEDGGRGEPFPRGHFGFGRRVCPGQLLGEASVWMVVATLLHTLRIEKARGADGEEVTPVVRLTGGLTS